jgi:hypothetical protein
VEESVRDIGAGGTEDLRHYSTGDGARRRDLRRVALYDWLRRAAAGVANAGKAGRPLDNPAHSHMVSALLQARRARMPFLAPRFDPDVFVSYSHGDPRGMGRFEDQIGSLEDEVDGLNIWCDRGLDPTAHLTDNLKGKVGACGVLIIVMRKRYLGLSWCRDERGHAMTSLANPLRVEIAADFAKPAPELTK